MRARVAVGWRVAAVIVVIAVIAVAMVLVLGRRDGVASGLAAAAARAAPSAVGGRGRARWRSGQASRGALDRALDEFARRLEAETLAGLKRGGARRDALSRVIWDGSDAPAGKHWTAFATWEELRANKAAWKHYARDVSDALVSLKFDWADVLREVTPRLKENREYVGLINMGEDGKLKVAHMEPSPIENGTVGDKIAFSYVPVELVEKVAARPALFFFHTHPDDPRGSALPSSADISAAISMGFARRYAAEVMISRYGVFVYRPGAAAEKAVERAADPGIAMRHYRHDTVAAVEGIRSWRGWTLRDYQNLFDLYGMVFLVYPSSEFTADAFLHVYRSQLDAPSNDELLEKLRRDISEHEGKAAVN